MILNTKIGFLPPKMPISKLFNISRCKSQDMEAEIQIYHLIHYSDLKPKCLQSIIKTLELELLFQKFY